MPKKVKYSGFGRRLVAYIIDSVIINIIFIAILVILALPAAFTPASEAIQLVFGLLALSLMFITPWIYYAGCESSKRQATPGKLACGIKVTNEKGKRISFGRASGRFFGKILSSIILYIGFIMIAFTEKHQGLHDVLAECVVVKEK